MTLSTSGSTNPDRSTKVVDSALPLLTFVLQHYGSVAHRGTSNEQRVAAVTLESLWINMEHEWRFAIQAFIEGIKCAQLTTSTREEFQVALSSLVLLVVVARRVLGLERVSWVHTAESRVFGDIIPSITESFSSVHDPTWDDFYAAILCVLGSVAQCTSLVSSCTVLEDSSAAISSGSGEALEWCKAVLLGGDTNVPHLCQNVALLLAVAMEVDVTLTTSTHAEGDAVQHAFTAVFLQCANMLSDAALTRLLLRAVERGSVRGDRLYATDLDVLLCILQRYAARRQQQPNNDTITTLPMSDGAAVAWISTCEALLLRDIAPPQSATVADVNAWLRRLSLEGDYQSVVRRQGIDGEVLWSDLMLEDVVEMGIYSRRDAAKILAVLGAQRRSD
jgi:hypothetical protein